MESRDGMGSRVYDVASRLFFRKLKMFTLKDIFGDPKENRDCSLSCFFVSWMCVVSKCTTTLAEFKDSSLKWVCGEGQPEDQLRVMVDLPGDVSERALTHHHPSITLILPLPFLLFYAQSKSREVGNMSGYPVLCFSLSLHPGASRFAWLKFLAGYSQWAPVRGF